MAGTQALQHRSDIGTAESTNGTNGQALAGEDIDHRQGAKATSVSFWSDTKAMVHATLGAPALIRGGWRRAADT